MAEASLKKSEWYVRGLKAGIPIGLGYFAVSFALGITAKQAGMSVLQCGVMSATMMASAGQFAVINMIATDGGIALTVLSTLIINLRYLLMSTALSQKIMKDTPIGHRLGSAMFITDEMFGVAATTEGKVSPFLMYGMASASEPGWVAGTMLGAAVGAILPVRIVNALSVALYGMFMAVVIPPAHKNTHLFPIIIVSMLLSTAMTYLPVFAGISSGMRIILLTVVISAAAALIWPAGEEVQS